MPLLTALIACATHRPPDEPSGLETWWQRRLEIRAERRRPPAGPTVRDIHFVPVDPESGALVEDLGPWERLVRATDGLGDSAIRVAMQQDQSSLSTRLPFLRSLVPRAVLDESTLAQDAWRVELWYAHHGYFDARVLGWEVRVVEPAPRFPKLHRPRFRVPTVDLVAYVDEGPASVLTSITVKGLEEAGRPIVQKVDRSKATLEGERFDIESVYDVRAFVVRELQSHSYAHAAAELRIVAHPEQGTVEAIIDVKTGPPCVFGLVDVQGEAKVPEAMIRERIAVLPGSKFDPQALERTQRDLFAMGTFTYVQVIPRLDQPGSVIPVEVRVVEAPFKEAKVGGGLAYDSGSLDAHATGAFSNVNTMSRLVGLDLEVTGGWRTFWQATTTVSEVAEGVQSSDQVEFITDSGPFLETSLGLTWPHFPLPKTTFQPQAAFELGQERGYRFTQVAFSPTLPIQVGHRTTLTPFYRFEAWKLTYTEPALAQRQAGDIVSEKGEAAYQLHQIGFGWRQDRRDSVVSPRRGSYVEVGASAAGWPVLPGLSFGKSTFDIRFYRPVVRDQFRAVAAFRVGGGAVVPYGPTDRAIVPQGDLLMLGGGTTVRGWAQDQIGARVCVPKNTADVEKDCWSLPADQVNYIPVGNRAVAYTNLELRMDGPFDSGFVVFTDSGVVYPNATSGWAWLPTAGVGLRYGTPAGALRVDVGVRLDDDERYDSYRRWGLHIGLSEAF